MTGEEEDNETKFLVVIGMNRPRLHKITALVEERQSAAVAVEAPLRVSVVPCLAAMGSYEDENGNSVRYLSNVVYHDGSPMTIYFDDETFRENLHSALLVGYEWHDGDDDKIRGYFQANQLEISSVECVKPNAAFENLQDEMEAFKNLDEEAKQRGLLDGTMGPGKMAKAIVDVIHHIQNSKAEEVQRQNEEAERAAHLLAEAEATSSAADESPVPTQPQHEPADQDRPRYACRMCRTILFGENHLAQDHVQNRHSFKKAMNGGKRATTPAAACQSIFCSDDVLQWLSPSGQDIEGKLTCPRCSHKIGHWKWAGAQCSCGTWVTPAIQIPVSKVDIIAPASTENDGPLVGIVKPIILSSDAP